jgi:hypothetical protein
VSISGTITGVTIIQPMPKCEICGTTGIDPDTQWDSCPRCHGAVCGKPVVFLVLSPGSGQTRLRLLDPPSIESAYYSALEGVRIWGNAQQILIGDRVFADRVGYTQIRLKEVQQ